MWPGAMAVAAKDGELRAFGGEQRCDSPTDSCVGACFKSDTPTHQEPFLTSRSSTAQSVLPPETT